MKERPILFNGNMIRAILDGRKTQTRRVIKPQPELGKPWNWWTVDPVKMDIPIAMCPYGIPGDRLWVRETWTEISWTPHKPAEMPPSTQVIYRATPDTGWTTDTTWENAWHWRPSIHMPRWASRITLEVTGVGVERVQAITDEDARAEGAVDDEWDEWYDDVRNYAIPGARIERPRDVFHTLWDSINAKSGYGWNDNPWVFVISFRRID